MAFAKVWIKVAKSTVHLLLHFIDIVVVAMCAGKPEMQYAVLWYAHTEVKASSLYLRWFHIWPFSFTTPMISSL